MATTPAIRLGKLLNPMPKRCPCGKVYTEAQWQKLHLVGYTVFDWGEALEYRDCPCGSTIVRTWEVDVG